MPKGEKKQARKPRDKSPQLSRPVISQEVTLKSHPAQSVFDRCFERTAESLFILGVVLQIIATKEQTTEVESVVDGYLTQLAEDTQREKGRLEKLVANNGITDTISFTEPRTIKVEISSPRAARLLARICELDDLVAELTKLWIAGELSDAQYSTAIYQQQQRVLRKGVKIRAIAKRAMAAARRKQQEEKKAEEKPDQAKEGLEAAEEESSREAAEGERTQDPDQASLEKSPELLAAAS